MEKKGKGFTIFLILVILGMAAYIAYDKGAFNSILKKDSGSSTTIKKEENKTTAEDVKESKAKLIKELLNKYKDIHGELIGTSFDESISSDSVKIEVAFNNVPTINAYGGTSCTNFLDELGVKYSNDDGGLEYSSSYNFVNDCHSNSDEINTVYYDILNESYKNLFNKELEKKYFEETYYNFIYSDKSDSFGVVNKADGPYAMEHNYVVKSAFETNDLLKIEVYKITTCLGCSDSGNDLLTFKNNENVEIDYEKYDDKELNEIVNKYGDKLDVYKIEFGYNKGSYYYKSTVKE